MELRGRHHVHDETGLLSANCNLNPSTNNQTYHHRGLVETTEGKKQAFDCGKKDIQSQNTDI